MGSLEIFGGNGGVIVLKNLGTSYNSLSRDYWVTADGRKLKPEDMNNSHLINTVLYLERNADRYKNEFDISLSEKLDSVTDCFDMMLLHAAVQSMPAKRSRSKVIRYLWNMDPLEWLKQTTIYTLLLREIDCRGLGALMNIIRKRMNNEK